MLAINVRDHGENRAELEKRSVAFVRFHHQEVALAHARVRAAHGSGLPADDYRWIEPAGIQHCGGHRRRGGFAMASRDCDAVLQPHQLGEQLAARDDRDLQHGALLELPDWRHRRPSSPPSPSRPQRWRPRDLRRSGRRETANRSVVGLSFKSEPLISYPKFNNTSAMPLMPMPPIPTKCRCCGLKNILILYCFGFQVECQWTITSSSTLAARRAASGCAKVRARSPMRCNNSGRARSFSTSSNNRPPSIS